MARPRTVDDKVIIERYRADEEVSAIAAAYGVDQKTIYNVLKRNGVTKKQARLTEAQRLEISTRYKNNESAVAIAAALGVSKGTVYTVIRKTDTGTKRTMGSLSVDEEDAIVARYAAGEPVLQISRDFTSVHVQTIHNMLERRGAVDPARAKPPVGAIKKEQILDAVRGGSNVPAAMTAFGVSESTVSRLLRETRAAGESIELPQGHPRTCAVDDAAFDVLTPDSLYWRGFLHADGCVHQDAYGSPVLVCGLAERDIGHLVKLRDFLKSTHAIAVHQGKQSLGGPTAYYRVRSKQICASLTAYGLVTHRTQSPALELVESPDFWRGAVDGDGWIGVSENKGNFYAYIGFCGQLPVVEAYQQFLSERGLAEANIAPTESGIWKIQTAGAKATAIIRLLYKDAPVVLDRKQTRAKDIIAGNLKKFPPYVENASKRRIEKYLLEGDF